MIPEERDDRPAVTMTRGELYAMMEKAVRNAVRAEVHDAVWDILRQVADEDRRAEEAETLVGGEAIAKAIGVDRSTLYRMFREGTLGNAVRQTGRGGKLIARRSELLDAIPGKA